ncbi:hypothetical protein ACJJTC_012037 [Scirpophaga incertulas]
MSNVKGLLNCLVRFKVTSLRDLAGMAGKRSASPNLFDTEGWPEVKNPKLVRKVKKNMEHQTMEGKTLEKNLVEENIETKKTIAKGCSDCDVLNNSVGDFDKRQDLFSQVIGKRRSGLRERSEDWKESSGRLSSDASTERSRSRSGKNAASKTALPRCQKGGSRRPTGDEPEGSVDDSVILGTDVSGRKRQCPGNFST